MRRTLTMLPVLLATLAGAAPASAWTWPADGPVLQPFTFGDDPYVAGLHRGIDIQAEPSSAVRAPASGVVTFAGTVPGGGRTVTITTPGGYAVTLVHLGTIEVAAKVPVAEGAAVGTIGPSGEPEHPEPYVHLGLRIATDPQGYLDPALVLPTQTVTAPAEAGVPGSAGGGAAESEPVASSGAVGSEPPPDAAPDAAAPVAPSPVDAAPAAPAAPADPVTVPVQAGAASGSPAEPTTTATPASGVGSGLSASASVPAAGEAGAPTAGDAPSAGHAERLPSRPVPATAPASAASPGSPREADAPPEAPAAGRSTGDDHRPASAAARRVAASDGGSSGLPAAPLGLGGLALLAATLATVRLAGRRSRVTADPAPVAESLPAAADSGAAESGVAVPLEPGETRLRMRERQRNAPRDRQGRGGPHRSLPAAGQPASVRTSR